MEMIQKTDLNKDKTNPFGPSIEFTPLKINMLNLKITQMKRKIISQTPIFAWPAPNFPYQKKNLTKDLVTHRQGAKKLLGLPAPLRWFFFRSPGELLTQDPGSL